MMYGAIIGDIAGSRFEFNNIKHKNFETLCNECYFTDDTVATIAIADAIKKSKENGTDVKEEAIKSLKTLGKKYPNVGWGWMFYHMWLKSIHPEPYNSFGNGSAMRISAAAWMAESEIEAIELAVNATVITHNHAEGIKGAIATTLMIYRAIHGASKEELMKTAEEFYDMDFTLDEIRDTYEHSEACQDTLPQAFEAFFEGEDFEDVIKNAIALGGDSDTIAAIAGSVAEAYYGVPHDLKEKAMELLTPELRKMVEEMEVTV